MSTPNPPAPVQPLSVVPTPTFQAPSPQLPSQPPPQPPLSQSTASVPAITLRIEKLADTNWFAWTCRMTAILKWKKVYDVVVLAQPRPLDPSAAAEWTEKDYIGRALIATSVNDEQVVHIADCDTSAEMWQVLRTAHAPRTQTVLTLKKKLYRMKALETDDIPLFLSRMRSLRKRLALCGEHIADSEFKSLLVGSLPRSWEGFVSSYLGCHILYASGNQQAQSMTVQELVSFLSEKYEWRQGRMEFGGSTSMPNAGTSQPSPCTVCGLSNHVTAACRHRGKPKCRICGKLGHQEARCYQNQNAGRTRSSKRVRRSPMA